LDTGKSNAPEEVEVEVNDDKLVELHSLLEVDNLLVGVDNTELELDSLLIGVDNAELALGVAKIGSSASSSSNCLLECCNSD